MERALGDLLVVDLTSVRSGPTCTKILADFGAEVVRIERPGETDRGRVFYDHADLHRNKKSMVVNLQDGRGLAVVRRLAAQADVLVENYRPDVKRRLGIDQQTLARENPTSGRRPAVASTSPRPCSRPWLAASRSRRRSSSTPARCHRPSATIIP